MRQKITGTLTITLLYLEALSLHNQISITPMSCVTWASCLISVCIILPICKAEVIIAPPSKDCGGD